MKEAKMNTTSNQIADAEREASLLMDFAMALSKAATSDNEHEKLIAIDNNLKLWVEIETSLKSAKNLLPEDVKNNLIKLSKFVEWMTLTKGTKMTKSDFDSLVNINMQISEGLLEAVKNNLAAEEAFSLLKCALDLSNARDKSDSMEIASALDNNLKLWVYIKTLANSKKSRLPEDTKNNLIKLADYVSKKTIEVGQNIEEINDRAIDSMIMTNLQISEGLMSSQMQQAC